MKRVTPSVAHCMVRPRSGSSASRSAPASGVKTMRVRMMGSKVRRLFSVPCAPDGAAEDHDGEDGGRADGEPAGVGADVAGDLAAFEPAEAARCEAGGAARAVDDTALEEGLEDAAGEDEQRDDDDVRVDLVDPVFVVEESVGGLVARGERGGGAGLFVVEEKAM